MSGTHYEGNASSTAYTHTCTSSDVIASGSITGSGYVFVKIIPYLEGWTAGTLPGGTLPSTLPGTLPAGNPVSSKIDYEILKKKFSSRKKRQQLKLRHPIHFLLEKILILNYRISKNLRIRN